MHILPRQPLISPSLLSFSISFSPRSCCILPCLVLRLTFFPSVTLSPLVLPDIYLFSLFLYFSSLLQCLSSPLFPAATSFCPTAIVVLFPPSLRFLPFSVFYMPCLSLPLATMPPTLSCSLLTPFPSLKLQCFTFFIYLCLSIPSCHPPFHP